MPLTPISKGMNWTECPVSLMSWISDEYLLVLCSLALSSLSSHGQVSSIMTIDGLSVAVLGSMITMSGFSAVTTTSGGMVPHQWSCLECLSSTERC